MISPRLTPTKIKSWIDEERDCRFDEEAQGRRHRGRATLLPGLKISINGETHEADNVLLCTGSSPSVPPIPGIDSEHVVDSTGILNRETLPDHLIIVGGGVIGCEFACMYASVGVPVTVLEAMPEICPNLDAEIASASP